MADVPLKHTYVPDELIERLVKGVEGPAGQARCCWRFEHPIVSAAVT